MASITAAGDWGRHRVGMTGFFTVEDRGKSYRVELGRDGVAGERWIVTLGGTAITALDRLADDTPDGVARRLRSWLAAHPGMDSRDDIHLGGG